MKIAKIYLLLLIPFIGTLSCINIISISHTFEPNRSENLADASSARPDNELEKDAHNISEFEKDTRNIPNAKHPIAPVFKGAILQANPQRTGVYNTADLRKLSKTKWENKVSIGSISSPAIIGNRIYLGSVKRFYSIDRSTGKVLWNIATKENLLNVTTSGDYSYVSSANGYFYGINTKQRKIAWEHKYQGHGGFSPVAKKRAIFFTSRVFINNNSMIYIHSLNRITGERNWVTQFKARYSSQIAIINELLIVYLYGSKFSSVYAFKAATGKVVWSSKTLLGNLGQVAASENHAYIATSKEVAALELKTGAIKWRSSIEAQSFPAIVNGKVIVNTKGALYALDAATGETKWKTAKHSIYTSPSIGRNVVYVGTYLGEIMAFNIANGKELWRYQVEGKLKIMYPPIIHKGIVYLSSYRGKLIALE